MIGVGLISRSGGDTAQGTQIAPKTEVKPIAPTRAVPATTSTAPTATTITVAPTTTTTVAPELATGILATPAVLDYLASRPGRITAAVYDYGTGQLATYRGGLALPTASVIKLDILEALLARDRGQGRSLTPGEQRQASDMIELSDNESATDLWDAAGRAPGLEAFGAQLGLTGTTPDPAGYWGLSTTTATDQVLLLRNLTDPSATLAPSDQAYALGLLGQVEASQAWGVTAGVAPGTTVALKDGWLPEATGWYVNSVGVVTGPAHHYALAVLSAGDPTQDAGEDTIAGLSGLVWAATAH